MLGNCEPSVIVPADAEGDRVGGVAQRAVNWYFGAGVIGGIDCFAQGARGVVGRIVGGGIDDVGRGIRPRHRRDGEQPVKLTAWH